MSTPKPKEPLVAATLSFLLSGLGQAYSGRLKRGILFFGITATYAAFVAIYIMNPATRLNLYLVIVAVAMFCFKWYIIADAYSCAKLYNTKNGLERKSSIAKRIILFISIALVITVFNPSIFFSLYVRNNLVQAFKIPTGTMRPTLIEGDRILVDKRAYKKSGPKRGDIIVFEYPVELHKSFIKRVVGMPNETLEIKNGKILIGGHPIREPELIANTTYYNKGDYAKEGEPVKIPADSYYVLGDNSSASRDSRYFGFVHKKNIIGKAYKIYFPFERSGEIK